jgi:hypothetical protein
MVLYIRGYKIIKIPEGRPFSFDTLTLYSYFSLLSQSSLSYFFIYLILFHKRRVKELRTAAHGGWVRSAGQWTGYGECPEQIRGREGAGEEWARCQVRLRSLGSTGRRES